MGVTFGWSSPENGPIPRFGRSTSAETVQGEDHHRATSGARPVRRAEERGGWAGAPASHPNWLAGQRSSRRRDGASACPGQRDCVVTATGRATGNRADNAASPAMPSGTTGDVRSSAVGGVICLVNSVNERDLSLLNSCVNPLFRVKRWFNCVSLLVQLPAWIFDVFMKILLRGTISI